MKVSELRRAQLDYWVARAERISLTAEWNQGDFCMAGASGHMHVYSPSTNWSQGGPIIEREKICLMAPGSMEHDLGWEAFPRTDEPDRNCIGPTPLIAAMRAYVASKFGEEVPDE